MGDAKRDLVREFRQFGCPERPVDAVALEVMKAETAARPFSRPGWLFELKLDGYRLLGDKSARGTRLLTRNGKELTARFPEIAAAVAALPFPSLLLDGELVAFDGEGQPSFSALQKRAQRPPASDAPAVAFFVFDVLACQGFDLRALPLAKRKEILARLLPEDPEVPLRRVEAIPERGEDVYRAAVGLGLEGIVAKRADSPYRSGYSADWQKVRVDQVGDFAVVGFEPSGRGSLRSLHLGVREGAGFAYAGSVGSGLSQQGAVELRAALELARRKSPAVAGAPDERGIVWVEPEQVVEVRYKERTSSGSLRQPVYLRRRDDKSVGECFLREARVDAGVDRPPAGGLPRGGRSEVAMRGAGGLQGGGARLRVPREEGPRPPSSSPAGAVQPTNSGKVFWPEDGLTKGDLFAYYGEVYSWLEPYLADRPLVVDRYPDGIAGKSFFQKSAGSTRLPGVETVTLTEAGRAQDYFVCHDLGSLLALVNLGVIPLHVTASRIGALERPDWCILDLDPKAAPWGDVVRIALALRAICEAIGLPSFAKTSGGSGLHVLLPLGGLLSHEESRALAELLARLLTDRLPAIATTARSLASRRGRVYVDALQNGRGKLLAAPFSARPRPGATVSAPLRWEEVRADWPPDRWTIRTLPARMAALGEDPLLPVLTVRPDLGQVLERLAADLERDA